MKTIVVGGGSSGVGKTVVAKDLLALLPESVHVKIGHHDPDPGRSNLYFRAGTPLQDIEARIANCRYAIIESNSILADLVADCVVYLPSVDPKASAALALQRADIVRGRRIAPATVRRLAGRLGLPLTTVRRMAWLSGARPMGATAVVLAGGQSRRMGTDKALLEVDGEPMIDRVCRQLAPWFDHLLVAAGRSGDRVTSRSTVADRLPGCGPLAGIEAGLAASSTERNFVVACDIPVVDRTAVFRLLAGLESRDISVMRLGDGRPDPLFAGYRRRVAVRAHRLIADGRYKVSSLFETCPVVVLECDDPSWYRNLNTPGEYREFLVRRPESSLHGLPR